MATFATPDLVELTIDLVVGDVRVVAEDTDVTVVEVRPTDPDDPEDVRVADQTRIEGDERRVAVRAPKLRAWVSRRGGSVDVVVTVPTGSHLHATLGWADLQVDGGLGDCRIRTAVGRVRLASVDALRLKSGAGDVEVQRVAHHADVVAGSGDVRLHELEATGAVRNANGATWVGTAHGELRLQAANGDIAVDRAEAGVAAKSANGDVRLEEVVRGAVVLETQVGDLEVGIRPGSVAWLDAQARAGTVHNTLDEVGVPDDARDIVRVRARTTLGGIVVRRPRGATEVR